MSSDSKETPDKFRKQSQTKPKKKKNTPIPQYPQTKMEGQFNSGTV